MIDENLARLRAHRNNITRYRSLLGTRLSDIERQFITRRLSEEMAALQRLTQPEPLIGVFRAFRAGDFGKRHRHGRATPEHLILGERIMKKSRNRVTHSSPLAERLAAEAQRLREIARGASAGSKREE